MRTLPALLGSVLLSACIFGGKDEGNTSGVWSDPYLEGRIAAIRTGLEETRGLAFKRPTYLAVISPEKYRSLVQEDADAFYTPEVDKGVSREMAQLGFFLDTLASMKAVWSGFQGSFPAGYYLPGKDSIYILTPYGRDEWFLQYGLPHELMHALQDQALDAWNRGRIVGEPRYYEDDFNLAYRCLFEGDAEFTAYVFDHRSRLGEDGAIPFAEAEAKRRRNGLSRWQSAPPEERLFLPSASPYDMGMRLASDVVAAEGFAGLTARYGRPGLSSLSVLRVGSAPPEPIDLDWLPTLFDTAGSYADDYGHGALYLMALAGPRLSSEALDRGMGWRGDRVFYRKRSADTWGTLVWALSFASEGDAESARNILSSVIAGRFGGSMQGAAEEAAGSWDKGEFRRGGGLETYLIRQGRQVWWVEGAGDNAAAVLDSLGSRPVTGGALAKRGAVSGGGPSGLFPPGGKVFLHSWK